MSAENPTPQPEQVDARLENAQDIDDQFGMRDAEAIKTRQDIAEFLAIRPGENGSKRDAVTGKFTDTEGYHASLEEKRYQESMPKAYEDMGILELAHALGDAEVNGDKTKAIDINDVLMDKIVEHVDKAGLESRVSEEGDPVENFMDIVIKEKERYVEEKSAKKFKEAEEKEGEESVAETDEASDDSSEEPSTGEETEKEETELGKLPPLPDDKEEAIDAEVVDDVSGEEETSTDEETGLGELPPLPDDKEEAIDAEVVDDASGEEETEEEKGNDYGIPEGPGSLSDSELARLTNPDTPEEEKAVGLKARFARIKEILNDKTDGRYERIKEKLKDRNVKKIAAVVGVGVAAVGTALVGFKIVDSVANAEEGSKDSAPTEQVEESQGENELAFEDKVEAGDGITHTITDYFKENHGIDLSPEQAWEMFNEAKGANPESILEMFPGSSVMPDVQGGIGYESTGSGGISVGGSNVLDDIAKSQGII